MNYKSFTSRIVTLEQVLFYINEKNNITYANMHAMYIACSNNRHYQHNYL